jgi:ATP-dependent Lon protease
VVLPARNAPDLEEVPQHILDALDVRLVSRVDEILDLVCEPGPTLSADGSLGALPA